MVCEIIIECNKCGKVVFGNSMFPEEVGDFIDCPICHETARVMSKQLVNHEVVISIEKIPVTMVDKYVGVSEEVAYGKGKGRKRKE